ncbi:glycosyl transferase, group 2 family protein [Desulforapulum autotrophicum HRM2]|uniref:Glycosyl transferase, group 2 family protein n=1 Tax=Desulforapulum autotrophicum (strain ATCC 43914 / DSM 3382 / VKM B-1955 / HRM2) TaxID=177437 RepID=C0QE38_DESAH|nr:TIGR04283 family arsenosugar biosynthesis glycosyltransferase [Desulforapulum autotrophicum]ACN13155.1 glycosyl transferase, group 2 family protein [Desulforapulum autotrophicum HRM2]
MDLNTKQPISLTAIVPVLHEADIDLFLCDLVEQTKHREMEIIVVDGDPEGSTIGRISKAQTTWPAIKKITASRGRALQQNAGAAMARGDVLLFLHADTRLPRDFHGLIVETLAQGFSGGAFDLHIDSSHPLIKLISKIASFRSRITKIPYGDQAIFLKKELFNRIHGFDEIPLMEDIALMQKIKKSGEPFKILPQKVSTSARRWINQGICWTMVRNPIIAMLYYLGVPPRILIKFY